VFPGKGGGRREGAQQFSDGTDVVQEMMTSTTEQRSRMMAGIKAKNTKPEMVVRRAIHAMGYRFRLHRRDLPGTPDIVLPRLNKVVLVHGCFWHRHAGCKYAYMPRSNVTFWSGKFDANVRRDRAAVEALKSMRWDVLTIWECETRDSKRLITLLRSFLADSDEDVY
jgi:DNA mismatch endonuclease, patch repair protein